MQMRPAGSLRSGGRAAEAPEQGGKVLRSECLEHDSRIPSITMTALQSSDLREGRGHAGPMAFSCSVPDHRAHGAGAAGPYPPIASTLLRTSRPRASQQLLGDAEISEDGSSARPQTPI